MQKLFSSVFVRGIGSALQFVSYMVVAAKLSPAEYGVFQLNISLFVFLALLSKFGVENKLIARVGGRNLTSKARLCEYEQVVIVSVFLASVVVCATALSVGKMAGFEGYSGQGKVRFDFLFVVTGFALVSIVSAIYRALGRPLLSSLFEFVFPYGLFLVLVFILDGGGKSDNFYIALLSISVSASLVAGLGNLLKNKRDKVGGFLGKVKEVVLGSISLYVVDLTNFLMAWLPFYVLGHYGNDQMLGLYALSFRVSQVFNIVIIGANASVAAKIARFTSNKSYGEALRESRMVSFLGALVLAPLFISILWFGGNVFDAFYPNYAEGLGVLFVLAFAQLINAYTASSQMIIIFSGDDRFMRNVILFSMSITSIFSFVFIPAYGAFGAAIASSAGIILQNLISVIFCYFKYGSLPVYLPKIISLEKKHV